MTVANTSNISTIQILRSYSNTTPLTLQDGQLAYSFKSNTLFIGSNTGGVIAISDQTTANLAANLANSKVSKSGDRMTGPLQFFGPDFAIGQYDGVGIDLWANINTSHAQLNFANTNFAYVDGFEAALQTPNSQVLAYTSGNVEIFTSTDGSATRDTWTFDTSGTLTVPGPISGLGESKLDFTTYGPNTAYLTTTNDDSTALFMGTAAAELYADTSVQIRANTKGTSQNWTFGAGGTLTFPDNTIQTTAYTPGGEIDELARATANAAYFHANGAFLKANAAFEQANVTIGVDLSQNVRLDYSNTALTIAQGVDNSQNVRLAFSNTRMDISDGVDASQNVRLAFSNTRMDISDGVNASQNVRLDFSNTRMTIIEGVDVGQNTRITVSEGVDLSQNVRLDFSNTRMTIIEGVDVTQNTNIAATNQYATSAFSTANNAYTKANNALANTTGTFAGTLTVTGNVIANSFVTSGSSGNISGANFVYANTFVSSNAYIFPDGTVQTTAASTASFANGAYNQANTATVLAQAAYNQANVTIGVDATQNTRLTVIEGTDLSQNVRLAFSNTRMDISDGVNASQNVRLDFSNAAITIIQGVDVTQNTRLTVSEGVDLSQNVRLDFSNAAITIIQGVDTTQNTRLTVAEATDVSQNVRLDFSNTRMTIIEGVNTSQNSRMTIIEGTDTSQNNRMSIIEGVDVGQNTAIAATDGKMQAAYFHANGAFIRANSAFDAANLQIGVDNTQNTRMTVIEGTDVSQNARMTIIEGVDVTQNTNIANKLSLTGAANQTVSGNVVFGNNLTVTGNLVVLGNTLSLNVSSLEVEDTLIQLGIGNYTTDALTIGYVGHYNDGTNAHAGFIRDSGTKEFYAFQGYVPETTANTININDATFVKANIHGNWFKGNLIATTARVGGLDIGNFATAAFNQANTGTVLAQASFSLANATVGVDATQNTRLTVIEGTNASQNVRLDFSNTRMTIIDGVDATQNTAIAATDNKMQGAYNVANTADVRSVAAYFHANGAFIKANAAFDSVNVQIGVDTTQNTRLTVIEGTDLSQNVSINTQNSFISIIQGVDVGQNSRMTIIEGTDVSQNARITIIENTDVSQNVRLDFSNTRMNIIDGVDVGQNNRMTIIEGVDSSQNARMTVIEGTDVSQNARIAVSEGVDLSQNVRLDFSNTAITIIQGVDTSQNTRLTVVEGVDLSQNVRLDYSNTALTIAQGVDNSQNVRLDYSNTAINQIQSAWTANTVIVANSTGYLSNSRVFFTSSNNNLIVSGNVQVSNGSITTPATELTLGVTGDTFGAQYLRLQNRGGQNGPLFDGTSSSAALVDFGFKTVNGQRNIRYETRSAYKYIPSGDGLEFQIGDTNDPTFVTSNNSVLVRKTTASISNTTGALVVGGGLGVAGNTFFNNSLAAVTTTTSAVNYLQVTGNTTGIAPTLTSAGSDTNIDLNLLSKGTGSVNLLANGSVSFSAGSSAGGPQVAYLKTLGTPTGGAVYTGIISSDASTSSVWFTKGSGTHFFNTNSGATTQFTVSHTASADRYVQISGGQAGVSSPSIGVAGGGSAFDLYAASGSNFNFYTNGNGSARQAVIAHTASAVNYIQATGNTTGGGAVLSAQGSDTNVGININPKGAGSVNVTSTTSSTSNTTGALVVTGGLGLSGNLTMSIVPNVGRLTLSPTHFIYNDSAGIVFTGSNYYYFNNTGGVYNQTALIQRGPIYNDVGNTTVLFAGTSQVKIQNGTASSNTTTGALVVQGGVGISGALNATTKSFNIPHPTKEGKDLRYGSLEGPEFGVYVRGTLKGSNVIELPDYWTKLVDANTITVSLTPIGKYQKLSVKEVKDNTIIISSDGWFKKEIHCYYVVYGERADVDKLDVEG
jgi:hypothetical protein